MAVQGVTLAPQQGLLSLEAHQEVLQAQLVQGAPLPLLEVDQHRQEVVHHNQPALALRLDQRKGHPGIGLQVQKGHIAQDHRQDQLVLGHRQVLTGQDLAHQQGQIGLSQVHQLDLLDQGQALLWGHIGLVPLLGQLEVDQGHLLARLNL